MGLTMSERKAVTKKFALDYRRGDRVRKGQILDQVCELNGWHRSHARKALKLLYLSTPDFAGRGVRFDEVVDLADHIALEAADDVSLASALSGASGDVRDGRLMKPHPHDHCPIDRGVELAVASVVDAMLPAAHARACWGLSESLCVRGSA